MFELPYVTFGFSVTDKKQDKWNNKKKIQAREQLRKQLST